MNWIETLWMKLVNKTAVSVTAVEVEEETTAAELLTEILTESGVGDDYISEHVLPLFEDWYTGEANKESVSAALADFKKEHSGIGRNISKQQSAARLK
tara:strand:- start:187 stop:480 length:294 start_codon:yes stop_codon:yes gene_type:complete